MTYNRLASHIFAISLVGSGFFLASITSLSPVYFTFALSIIAILFFALVKKFPINSIIIQNLIIFVSVLLIQASLADFRRPFVSFLGHIYFIAIYWIGHLIRLKSLLITIKSSLYALCTIFCIELILRLQGNFGSAINALFTMNELTFYGLKVNSIMFMDTNHVAMVILPFYFLGLYLRKEKFMKTELLMISFLILLLFTYSRATIIATLFFTAIFFFFKPGKNVLILLLILFLLLIFVTYFLLPIFALDPSLLSKFGIFQEVQDYIHTNGFWRLFFGVGYGNSANYLGIGSHNLVFTYFVEGGIFTTLLIIILYYFIIKKHIKTLYVILPFVLAGMSFAPQVQTFYYSVLATIIVLENKKKLQKNE